MHATSFIGGDWGTSHLRLFLCDPEATVLDKSDGPGAAQVQGHFAATFAKLTAGWRNSHGAITSILCGMVGSNLGWTLARSLPCPVDPHQIAEGCIEVEERVHIVPGLSCTNRFGVTDFMRGEETQILGAVRRLPQLAVGKRMLCLPGTHTKWALLEDGSVREFFTAPTGELFAVLRDHSVLVRAAAQATQLDTKAFQAALKSLTDHPRAQLLHRLFECRSRQLSGQFTASESAAFLSGLLVGSDVRGALELSADFEAAAPVCVVGSSGLNRLYREALEERGVDSIELDGSCAVVAGLGVVRRHMSLTGAQ
jgi:2-dehydro-3-deoxygalactonokinase